MKKVKINNEMLKVAPELCYLGTCSLLEVVASWLSSHAANVHGHFCHFCQLLPLPINRSLLVLTGCLVCSTCVRSVILPAAETWAMSVAILNPIFDSVISRQRMKLVQTPFSQSLASRSWMLCSATVG